jgi:uncharacterized LabA/DUF88 family protein
LSETRLKIAVFIDFDNIEIGVKTTLGGHFDVGAVLEAIKERGEVVTKIAYGDWTRAGDYSRSLTQHAIHMVQRNLTPGGDKNGADINLALDALEMAFTHNHINAFVIVGGDSDFMALVEKLKQYDRKVFVVGGRAFTSVILQKNCTEFIAYENLVSAPARSRTSGGRAGGRAGETPALNAVPLIRRALKVLLDREVSPQLGVLKSTLLQLDSTFSEREYGASTFRDFVQRLARAGYLTLKGSDRNIYVELKEGADGAASGGSASGAGGSGAGTGLAAGAGGSGAGQATLPAGKDSGEGDAAEAGEPALASVIEGDFGSGVGAGGGAGLHGDVAGSGAGPDAEGMTASGGAGSLGEAAVDQGPGPNGSASANEAYASSATDDDDTETVQASTAPPARVWERVRDSDRRESRESERGSEGGRPDAGRSGEARGGDAARAGEPGRAEAGRGEASRGEAGRGPDPNRQPNGGRGGQGYAGGGGGRREATSTAPFNEGVSGPAGSPPAALRFISDVFHRPGIVQRWPLYLRQVKQILRSVDESFDERRYGFTGIVEALRYCQREGLFRLDRDRQGVLRVYPGPVLQRASTAAPQQAIDTDATPGNVAAAPIEDDDNRGNRIESGDRYERGGRGDRDRRDRGDRAARGDRGTRDRSDQGGRGEGGEADARPRREDRAEYGEPLAPGTLELFPLTEATADADADANAASSGDGVHGPLSDDTTAVSPAEADVTSDADASGSAAETSAGDEAGAPRAAKGRRGARGGRGGAKKTAAKSSPPKSGKSAAPAEKRAAEKPAAEKSSSKPKAAKNTRARKAAKPSGA